VQEDIYIRQAPGYSNGDPKMVRKLNKSLYGLKQSPFNWNLAIHDFLVTQYNCLPTSDCPTGLGGWHSNLVDHCLYTKKCPQTGRIMILTLYVDDLLITGDWSEGIADFKAALMGRFAIQDLGRLEHCLGFNVTYEADQSILLNQYSYIDQLLTKFDMVDATPVPTPAVSDIHAYTQHGGPTNFPYRELVGSLLYLSLVSRPDIANAVRMLSKYQNDFTATHVVLAKRVLRYLKDTRLLGLRYRPSTPDEENVLTGYCDASYADNIESSRSTTGFVHFLNGAPVMWQSKCQKTVARSSCEAEYMAMSDATNEIVYIRQLLADMMLPTPWSLDATTLYVDNKSAIFIGNMTAPTKLSRHIAVRFHNVQQEVKAGVIQLIHIPSARQFADMLTKNLNTNLFYSLRRHLVS